MTTPDQWCWSHNEQDYFGCVASEQEAITRAPGELGIAPGDRYWVARIVHYTGDEFIVPVAEDLIDGMHERAGEMLGDHVGDWPDATADQLADLDDQIKAFVSTWISTYGLRPWFHGCDRVSEHVYDGGGTARAAGDVRMIQGGAYGR